MMNRVSFRWGRKGIAALVFAALAGTGSAQGAFDIGNDINMGEFGVGFISDAESLNGAHPLAMTSADDVFLPDASLIYQVGRLVFWGLGMGIEQPGLHNITGFEIGVYDLDADGLPGNLLWTQSFALSEADPVEIGQVFGNPVYRFAVTPSGLELAGGQSYAVQIGGLLLDIYGDPFVWHLGLGNDRSFYKIANTTLTGWTEWLLDESPGADNAFRLQGTAVPEPTGLASALVIAGLWAARRRRR